MSGLEKWGRALGLGAVKAGVLSASRVRAFDPGAGARRALRKANMKSARSIQDVVRFADIVFFMRETAGDGQDFADLFRSGKTKKQTGLFRFHSGRRFHEKIVGRTWIKKQRGSRDAEHAGLVWRRDLRCERGPRRVQNIFTRG